MDATLKETLDEALSSINKKTDGYLRNEDGERIGVFRWLPATEEEAKPIGGARIDAIAIEQMAKSLNDRTTAIPIDGGPTPTEVVDGIASEVHGTAKTGGGTPANGWAHAAVVHVGDDGVTELYLWAELFPSIAREVDAGRLAFGSVHFGFNEKDGDAPRDVTLISHALTNDPAVTTLSPANDVRQPAGFAFFNSRTRSLHMAKPVAAAPKSKTTIRSHLAALPSIMKLAEAKRGPALDRLAKVGALLGVSIEDEMSNEAWCSPISAAVSALKSVASTEKVLEGMPADEPVASAGDAAKSAKPGATGVRAEGDKPAEDKPADKPAGGDDAVTVAAFLEVARDLLGKPEATAAECIDLLKANADPIKKSISSGPDQAAQNEADQAAQASAEPKAAEEARAARMDVHELRSRIATLETERKKDSTELEGLRASALRTRVSGEIATALRSAKRVMSDEHTEALVSDLVEVKDDAARARHLARAVGAGAPTGDVMGGGEKPSATRAAKTVKTATDEFLAEAAKAAAPNESRQITRARAQKLARAAYPDLFGSTPANAEI